MKYKPGQWLFLNCPSVSGYQWHPFTITSCPFDPYISVHVRQVGDFTRALADALGAGQSQAKLYDELDPMGMYEVALAAGESMPDLRIDGPYGAPAEDVFDNEIAVMIGTGIGVTPWASILKNIWHIRMRPDAPTRLRRVEFIWICKDTSSFEWFQALLASLESQSLGGAGPNGGEGFLKIHTYLTQKIDPDTAQNIVLNSVGTDKDPLTELRSRTNFGRPDFDKLLVAMRDGILNGSYLGGDLPQQQSHYTQLRQNGKLHAEQHGRERARVGVYFCGPNVAAKEIKRACKKADCREVRFNFWKEHF
jgi:NADPH oxidase 1